MSMIDDVYKMNEAFGFEFAGGTYDDIESAFSNIIDEANEGIEACNNEDMTEVCDAFGDALVFAFGGLFKAGITENQVNAIMAEIYASNMSKFCESDYNLQQTIYKYEKLGIVVIPCGEGKFRHVRTPHGEPQTDINGKIYQANKFLKGVDFFPPNIKKIIKGEN